MQIQKMTLEEATQLLREATITDKNICGGEAVIPGTRFPVAQVLTELAYGSDGSILAVTKNFDLDYDAVTNAVQAVVAVLSVPFFGECCLECGSEKPPVVCEDCFRELGRMDEDACMAAWYLRLELAAEQARIVKFERLLDAGEELWGLMKNQVRATARRIIPHSVR